MSLVASNLTMEGQNISLPVRARHEPLLKTKLFVPPIRPLRVDRPHLFAQIRVGLDKPLILVSAPTGYGKTTLVSSWLRTTDLPVAWLSLDEGDNDPLRFLQYLVAALAEILPALSVDMIPVDLAAMLQGRQPVLDLLTFLLDYMPPQMHLVILSRVDPPLPFARLRARGHLLEIRAEQLRFTPEESARFLNDVMRLGLSADDLAALEQRTEGWIAGLQLAALSMQGCLDIHGFVVAFTGSHHYIMDYLVEEVLKRQRARAFLLQTSILNQMCGPLCTAVVEAEATDPLDGQAMLEALEQMNLFVIPIDDQRRWYRYHPLFADVLNRRLEQRNPEQLPRLHRRASHWYEQQAAIPEATQHALLAGDPGRAADLVDQHGCLLLLRGEVVTLLNLLAAIEPQMQARPWLTILQAWAYELTGNVAMVEPTLQASDRLLAALTSTPQVQEMRGCMATARAHRASMEGEISLAAALAQQALDQLPQNDPLACTLRGIATLILGDARRLSGEPVEAKRAYMDVVQISRAASNTPMLIIADSALAEILVEQGRLHQTARIFAETLQLATRPDGQVSPLAARLYAGLSRVAYAWNHPDLAERHARQCIALSQQWENHDLLAVGHILLARLGQVQGHPEQVQAALRAAEHLAAESLLSPTRVVWVQTAMARLWLAQGDLEQARRLVRERGIRVGDAIPYVREPEYLILVRLLLAQTEYDAALTPAQDMQARAEATQRVGRVIETLALQALAWHGKKETAQALTVLEQALGLAQPEEYVRPFLDEGEVMTKLLYQAKAQGRAAPYAAELLAVQGRAGGSSQPLAQRLIEPLTLREIEVLRLIDAGYANQEIAARLVISVATVKRHISNLYTKLGATSRTQALALARDLQLLQSTTR